MNKALGKAKNPKQAATPLVARLLDNKVTAAAMQFLRHRKSSAAHMLEMCHVIYMSKRDFTDQQFAELCQQIGYDPKGASIRKFEAIGKRYQDFKPYRASIPDNWTVLYKLTQVKPRVLTKAVQDGTLTSQTTARTITAKLLGGPPDKPQPTSKPMHSIVLTWNDDSDIVHVADLIDRLASMSSTYGNFKIVPSHRTGVLLENGGESSAQEWIDEVNREVKARFVTAVKEAKRKVPKGSTFGKVWGCSVEELKGMPINKALAELGYEPDIRVGDASYSDLVSR